MKQASRAVAALAMMAGLALAGCAHMPGGIAPSNEPIGNREYRVLGLTRGTDSHVLLFGFIPVAGSNSIRAAMEDAIRAKGADALIDITVEQYTQFWILFTRSVIKVEGYGIRYEVPRK